jgi:hypothetical protein
MNEEELFAAIQTFLNNNNENTTRDEEQEYQKLLEEFYQIPSYVERFKHGAKDEETKA